MEDFMRQMASQEYFDLKDLDVSYAALFPDDFFSSVMDASYTDSFAKAFSYGSAKEVDETASSFVIKPKILLMGHRRSGKKSIMQKVSPHSSLTIQSTNKLVKEDVTNSSFITFQLYDVPGILQSFIPMNDAANIFGTYAAVIFVIDVQDEYIDTLQKLQVIVTGVCRVNPNIKFNVFIHKVDNLSDAEQIEVQRDSHLKICDDLLRAGLENDHLRLLVTHCCREQCLDCQFDKDTTRYSTAFKRNNFARCRQGLYFTSIYDHSVLEAVSRVVQKLNPYLPTLENLLNIFTSSSRIEKAFLFNVVSKIYIATDSSPVDIQSYKICCDMIDVVFDVSCIYGEQDEPLFDTQSTSVIKLNTHIVLYLRKVNRYIALICILRMDIFKKRGFIEYNFYHFQEAVQEVFKLWKQRKSLEITPDSMARHLNELSTNYSHFPKDYKYQTIESPISGNSSGMCINSQQSSFE